MPTTRLIWARRTGADERPVPVPGKRPAAGGNVVRPGLEGALNRPSKSVNPAAGLALFSGNAGTFSAGRIADREPT